LNDDGVINRDEFKKLCNEFSPEIQTDAEIDAAIALIDTNKDGTIDFNEFVRYWQGKMNV
jgi:Ca2+-binding EF-hand superfamily protein